MSDTSRALEPVADRALAAAAEAAARRLAAELDEALPADELAAEVGCVVELVQGAGATTADGYGAGPAAPIRRRLLELLREELIVVWSAAQVAPAPREMLAMLTAVERARELLEPPWNPSFASRLMGSEGLELLIEVAHDLRSPLTSVLFLSETLLRGQSGEINETQRRQLGIIYSAGLGLISVASDVIELAQNGEQLAEREPSAFSVTEVLESVRDIVQPMAEEKGLQLRLLPPEQDRRLGYAVALSRVLLNLTTNALKFTDEGFVEIVARARGADRVEFSVRDTGNGIAVEEAARLFQPFRRRGGRGGFGFSGSGLGLTICRRLVEAMGAELQFETSPGWGTRFHFDLLLPPASRA